MNDFRKGYIVMLSDEGIRKYTSRHRAGRKPAAPWEGRIGIVKGFSPSAGDNFVRVHWKGNKKKCSHTIHKSYLIIINP